jgi:hypothetical protein
MVWRGDDNSLPLYHIDIIIDDGIGKQPDRGRNKGWGEWTDERPIFFFIWIYSSGNYHFLVFYLLLYD